MISAPFSAPRLVVNTPVKDVEVQEVDVYEMINEIKEGGTCVVYVPDIVVLTALDLVFGGRTFPLKFSEVCYPTYLCPEYRRYLELEAKVQTEMRRRYPGLAIPPVNIYVERPWKVDTCTTIGSPYAPAIWDYHIYYPPGMSPQELATLLREKKLKFVKLMPKVEPIENPLRFATIV